MAQEIETLSVLLDQVTGFVVAYGFQILGGAGRPHPGAQAGQLGGPTILAAPVPGAAQPT